MKNLLFSVLLICLISVVFPEKTGMLSGVYHPEIIKVFDNEIYVVEGNKIFVFSTDKLTLKRKFDKEGNGPGEFKLDRNRSAAICVFPEMVVAESRFKVVFLDRKFNFIREMKKMPGVVQTFPIGDKYIIHKILYGPEGANYFTLNIYDKEMKMVKEIYRQKFFAFKGKTNAIPDGINFCVLGEKIFVEKSEEGPIVGIYDIEGTLIRDVAFNEKMIPVTGVEKEKALDHYLSIPALFQAVKQRGKKEVVNELKTRGGLSYPDYLPPFEDIKSDGKYVFVKTGLKSGPAKYYILDINGKIRGNITLPEVKRETFFNILQGDKKFYAFHNSCFYYLKEGVSEDEDEDIWEVHRVKIHLK